MKEYTLQDLMDIMVQLRAGCPWDKEQTYDSLKRFVIEEAYEVVDAVDEPDRMMLADELGDLLLQVVFYAQLGRETGEFDMSDILRCVCEKMIRRHPHVFGTVEVRDSDEVLQNWEKIKKTEKNHKTTARMMKEISTSIPALMRAQKVQEKAAKVGFDWQDAAPCMDKLREEVEEFANAATPEEREEEFGDLLFAAVNTARFADIQPELALQKGVDKFIRRFDAVEQKARADYGKTPDELSFEQLDALWDLVKCEENA